MKQPHLRRGEKEGTFFFILVFQTFAHGNLLMLIKLGNFFN